MVDIPKEDLSKIREKKDSTKIEKKTAEQISICLNTDENGSFTHSAVLNSIEDPNNTVLEFPL
jgi:predicted transcriptional regulator YdeE